MPLLVSEPACPFGGAGVHGSHAYLRVTYSSATGLSSVSLQSREDGLAGVVLRACESPLQAVWQCQSNPVPLWAAAGRR